MMQSTKYLLLSSVLVGFFLQSLPLKAVKDPMLQEDIQTEDQHTSPAAMQAISVLPSNVKTSEEELSTCTSGVLNNPIPSGLLFILFPRLGDIQSLGRVAQVSRLWKAAAGDDSV